MRSLHESMELRGSGHSALSARSSQVVNALQSAINRLIKCRDAAGEIAVFTSREKTRLTRAIWCVAEVEGARTGSRHEPRSRDADGGRQVVVSCNHPNRTVEACTTMLPHLTTACGQRHKRAEQATGRRSAATAPVIILENPSDADLHKREVRPC